MKKTTVYGIFLGLFCLLFSIAFSLILLHSFDFLYRADMILLGIPKISGLSEEVVLRNYKAMMVFLSPFSTAPFALPDLVNSANGAIHFEECRNIFRAVYFAGALSMLGMATIYISAKKQRMNSGYFKVAAITLFALPSIVAIAVAINANAAFVLFHKIFFRNDYWVFSSFTDPVINILPMDFFIHCAIFMITICAIMGAMLFVMYKKTKKHAPIYAYLAR